MSQPLGPYYKIYHPGPIICSPQAWLDYSYSYTTFVSTLMSYFDIQSHSHSAFDFGIFSVISCIFALWSTCSYFVLYFPLDFFLCWLHQYNSSSSFLADPAPDIHMKGTYQFLLFSFIFLTPIKFQCTTKLGTTWIFKTSSFFIFWHVLIPMFWSHFLLSLY